MNTTVTVTGGSIPQQEIDAYVSYVKDNIRTQVFFHRYQTGRRICRPVLAAGAEPFERIRRITGYLVGTLDRFNDANVRGRRPCQTWHRQLETLD